MSGIRNPSFNAVLTKTKVLIENEPKEGSASITAERVANFKTALNLLKDAITQLKAANQPALELAECHYLLGQLHSNCLSTYKKHDLDDHKRIMNAITHYTNAISFGKKVAEGDKKNSLIILSIISLTSLFGEPQALSAIRQLSTAEKKVFLYKLSAHISKGLESLAITEQLSTAGKAQIATATQPLLTLFNQASAELNRSTFFTKPLTLLGGAIGLGLGFSSGGLLNTALLITLWATAGSKTGEAVDHMADNCKRPKP